MVSLSRYFHDDPQGLSAEQVQSYLLHLLQERKLSRSTVNQAGCAFRFLYGTVLGHRGDEFTIPLARTHNGGTQSLAPSASAAPSCAAYLERSAR